MGADWAIGKLFVGCSVKYNDFSIKKYLYYEKSYIKYGEANWLAEIMQAYWKIFKTHLDAKTQKDLTM